jgi:hypothetical protein
MESFSQIKLSIPTSRAYRCRAAVSQSSSPSQILISRSMAHIVSDPLAFFCQQGDTTRAPVTPPVLGEQTCGRPRGGSSPLESGDNAF